MEENKKNKIPNVPNLRFDNSDWETYLFSNIFDIANGINKDK